MIFNENEKTFDFIFFTLACLVLGPVMKLFNVNGVNYEFKIV